MIVTVLTCNFITRTYMVQASGHIPKAQDAPDPTGSVFAHLDVDWSTTLTVVSDPDAPSLRVAIAAAARAYVVEQYGRADFNPAPDSVDLGSYAAPEAGPALDLARSAGVLSAQLAALGTVPKDASGRQLVAMAPNTQVGMTAVTTMDVPDTAVVRMQSWQIVVPAKTTLFRDIFVGDSLVGPQGRCYLAGGEYRVRPGNGHGAAEGSALHLAVVDRDNVSGAFAPYGLSRTRLADLTAIVGTIVVGSTVTGATSGAVAQVLAVGADYAEVTYHDGPFSDGEALTFSNGATAVVGDWIEGDVLEVVRNVKDEWIEDYDSRSFAPGGSREIPAGFYVRFICYNNHATDDLRVKVSLTYGAL